MDEKPLHLGKAGVYVFRAPNKLSVVVDRELVVVFTAPECATVGVVVHDPRSPLREMRAMLDGVFDKMTVGLKTASGPVHVKLFGVSHGDRQTLDAIRAWVHANGMVAT